VQRTVAMCLSQGWVGLYVLGSERTRGQGLLEYALILSFISLFAIVGLVLFGQSFASLLGNTSGGISSCITDPGACLP